ncbi:MAG: cation transporter [Clostridia bacterium]|nr:cation transporter [Clostridia bacterium]
MTGIKRKTRVAVLSVTSNTVLIIIKLMAGIASNSVSIISEAIHSFMDLVAAVIALISVRLSSKPADKEHPYGHGKIENVSGFIQGLLIFAAAAFIINESVKKIISPQPLKETNMGIVVMIFAAVVNIFVSRALYKVAREEDSVALEADALHLKTDVYTSAGVALGLALIKFTGMHILDPVIAIMVALLIIKEAWQMSRMAFSPLLDASLPDDEEQIISEILDKHQCRNFRFTRLRTRKSGPVRFIDFHAHINPELPIKTAYEVNSYVKREIEASIPNVHIHIDVETLDE